MKFEIMLSILFELLSKKCVSAKYLSEKHQVSTRSIYRYISALESAGVPLYSTQGKHGGFSIIDTYKLSSTFLSKEEFDKTINVLKGISDGIDDKVLQKVITKLKASIKYETSGFDVKSGNLIIDAGPWGDAVGYKTKLSLMQKCIDECLPLSITYHDRNGEVSNRIIEPHVIVFKQGLWYVYSYCRERENFRFFKLGRIEKANALTSPFTRRDINRNDLPLNWHESVPCEEVELLIDKSILSDAIEWLGVENVTTINDIHVANVKLPYDKGLISKIMSYGKGIKVVSPKKLAEDITASAKKILQNYE